LRAVVEAFGTDNGQWDMKAPAFAMDFTDHPLEFRFYGLNKPEHRRSWGNAAATLVWLAGARDLAADIFDDAVTLAGSWGEGVDDAAIILTSRMPASDHWIATRFGGPNSTEGNPRYRLFQQPGGRSARAENIAHVGPGFYARLADHLAPREIASEIDAEWGEPGGYGEDMEAVDPRRVALATWWTINGGVPGD
jgi:hypothetical protein